MSLLYPWVLLLILPWLYCLSRCPRQEEAMLFSNLPMLREVAGQSS